MSACVGPRPAERPRGATDGSAGALRVSSILVGVWLDHGTAEGAEKLALDLAPLAVEERPRDRLRLVCHDVAKLRQHRVDERAGGHRPPSASNSAAIRSQFRAIRKDSDASPQRAADDRDR